MRIAVAIGAACALFASAGAVSAQTAAAPQPAPTPPPAPAGDVPPPGPGLDLIQQKCVSCHAISMITSKRKTPDEWAATVDTMAGRGAEVSPDEMDVIVKYLAKTYPAAAPSSGAGR